MSNQNEIVKEITQKFGYFPLFYEPAKNTPAVLASLWKQTKDHYFDSPLPVLFKEKLAISLTQFSSSPYSFMFHIATLHLMGLHAKDIYELLSSQPKSYNELIDQAETVDSVLVDKWPEEGSPLEYKIHLLSVAIFLDRDVHHCHIELKKILPLDIYNHLVFYINFKYTSLKWTEAHSEIDYNQDTLIAESIPEIFSEMPEMETTLNSYLIRMRNQKALRNQWLKEENQKIFKIQEDLINLSIQKEEELTTLLDASTEGMYGIDTNGNISFINKAAVDILDFKSKSELLGKNAHELFHYKTKEGNHFPIRDCKIYEALMSEEPIEISDDTLWTRNGDPIPVEYRSTPIYNNENKLTGSFVTFRDLTFEYQAKHETKVETDRILSILDDAPIPLTITEGPDHTITYSNSKGPLYFQNRRIDIIGKSIVEVFPDFIENGLKEKLDMVYQTGNPYSGTELPIEFIQPNGSTKLFYIDVIYRPHFGNDGKIRGVLAVAIDSSEKVAQREELEHQKNEAKNANLTKNSFLANMSHEIRTPLNAIIGFTEVLQTSITSKEERDYLSIIRKNGSTLSKLIDDILDISKVEAGKLTVHKSTCDLIELVEDTIEVFKEKAYAKDVGLRFENPAGHGFMINSDPTRIRQILTNLIGNAVKFTKRGEVIIRLDVDQQNNALSPITILIEDTGIGLSQRQREIIFNPFVQADESTGRIYGGTGLGLALSKRLAEALGGDIKIDKSIPDVGSVFRFQFQAEVESNKYKTKIESEVLPELPLKNKSVLVVDDSKENRRLMKILLSQVGANVKVAESGKAAINKIEKHQFDLVLLDIQMPEMDGYQTLTEIKSRGFNKPIIALTAHAMTHEREKTKAHGFDGHETKPVDLNQLVGTILELPQQR